MQYLYGNVTTYTFSIPGTYMVEINATDDLVHRRSTRTMAGQAQVLLTLGGQHAAGRLVQ